MTEDKKPELTPVFVNLESALKLWWKNLKKFIFVYLWGLFFALISLAIVAVFVGLDYWLGRGNNTPLHILTIAVAIVGFLFALYFSIRSYMGMFLLVKKNYEGEEFAIFQETGQYFWPYLGLALLTAIFVLLWCLLLIIPGIIYGVFYSLAVYVFFFEDKRGLAAIRRSVRLIEGYWWPMFGRYVVIGLLSWLVMIVVSAPLAGSDIHSAFYQIWNMVVQIVSFLIGPIVLIYTYNIYQDLVKIKK